MNLPPCPVHSFFKRSHPELREDIISRPIVISRKAGFYVINGCQHSHRVFGPHDSQEVAEALWTSIALDLEADLSETKMADLIEYENRLKAFEKVELPELGQHELLR